LRNIEAKVQAKPVADQLHRRRKTALRHGYDEPHLVLITEEEFAKSFTHPPFSP
jgi:hypothetical protein